MPKCANDFSLDKVYMLVERSEDLVMVKKKFLWSGGQLLKGLMLITYIHFMKTSVSVISHYGYHVPKNLDMLIGVRLAQEFYEAFFLNKILHFVTFPRKGEAHWNWPEDLKNGKSVLSKVRKDKGRQGKIEDSLALSVLN